MRFRETTPNFARPFILQPTLYPSAHTVAALGKQGAPTFRIPNSPQTKRNGEPPCQPQVDGKGREFRVVLRALEADMGWFRGRAPIPPFLTFKALAFRCGDI